MKVTREGWRASVNLVACLAVLVLFAVAWPLVISSANVRPVLKIGLIAPFEGPERTMAYDVLFAARLAVQARNQAEHDREGALVELVALNDNGSAEEAGRRALAIAADPDVIGIVGPWSDSAASHVTEVARESRLAVIIPESGDQTVTVSDPTDGIVRLSADNERVAAAAIRLARRMGATRPAVLSGEQQLAEALRTEANNSGYESPAMWGPQDLADFERIGDERPDLLLFAGDAFQAADWLSRLNAFGIEVPIIGGPSLNRIVLYQLAPHAIGRTYPIAVTPPIDSSAATERFAAEFRGAAGRDPSAQAILAYDAVTVLLEAIDRLDAGPRSMREDVFVSLKSVADIEGLTGRIRFGVDGGRIEPPIWTENAPATG